MNDLQKTNIEIDVYNSSFEKIDSIFIPSESVPLLRKDLVQSTYVYYENKARIPNRGIISKEDMSFSTRKISPQKGRGKARRGSIKAAPLRKGQKAHGPSGEVNYKIKINKKVRELALSSAFFSKIRGGKIIVFENGVLANMNKTSEMCFFIKNISQTFGNTFSFAKKTLFCENMNLYKTARNIKGIKCANHLHVNVRTFIETEIIILEKQSADHLINRFIKSN